MLWSMMDDRQKKKYVSYAHKFLGQMTSDGVRMTWQRFGEAVGTTADTLKLYRRRATGDSAGSSTKTRVEVRRIRSDILSKEGALEEALQDPKVRKRAMKACVHTALA